MPKLGLMQPILGIRSRQTFVGEKLEAPLPIRFSARGT
jgi:hypothetical protein